MNCFEHEDLPAMGVCKHCLKGVCADCAVDTGQGLACPDCEEDVRSLNEFLEREMSFQQRAEETLDVTSSAYFYGSIFLLLLGLLVLFVGYLDPGTRVVTVPGGILLFLGAGLNYLLASRVPAE